MAGNRFFCVGEVAAALGGFAEIARLWCRNGDRNYVQTHVPAAVFLVPLGLVIGRCWLDTFRPRAGQITLVAVEFFSKANILRPLVLLMEHNSPSCSIWNHPVQWRLGRRFLAGTYHLSFVRGGRWRSTDGLPHPSVLGASGGTPPSQMVQQIARAMVTWQHPVRDWEELKATTAVGDRNVLYYINMYPSVYPSISIKSSINTSTNFNCKELNLTQHSANYSSARRPTRFLKFPLPGCDHEAWGTGYQVPYRYNIRPSVYSGRFSHQMPTL